MHSFSANIIIIISFSLFSVIESIIYDQASVAEHNIIVNYTEGSVVMSVKTFDLPCT